MFTLQTNKSTRSSHAAEKLSKFSQLVLRENIPVIFPLAQYVDECPVQVQE